MAIETTLADISEAATDADLRDRFISAAAEHGVPNPQGWVESQMRRLVAHKTNTNGDTVASTGVVAYRPTILPSTVAGHIDVWVGTLKPYYRLWPRSMWPGIA